MKKILTIVCGFLVYSPSFAQYKSGIVAYCIAAVDVPFKEGNAQNDMVKSLIEMAKAQKYELKFNSSFSSFTQIETLDSEQYDENLLLSAKSVYATKYSYFIDSTNKELITKTDDILLKSDAIASGWKISTETKMIDTYLCYKAIYTYEFVTRDNKTKTKTITAWFAPSLPFPYGPIEFHGLPGLILELNKDYTTYLAKKIVLLDEEREIDFPKGKIIPKDDYEKKILRDIRY
jgi:GLPGLI family protein